MAIYKEFMEDIIRYIEYSNHVFSIWNISVLTSQKISTSCLTSLNTLMHLLYFGGNNIWHTLKVILKQCHFNISLHVS